MNEEIAEYVRQLQHYGESEDIFFNLIELDDSLVPELIQAYWRESSRHVRHALLEGIWQHRLPATLGFLGEALQDNDPEIWKEALDGIVAMNVQEGIQMLAAEKERLLSFKPPDDNRLAWIEEAIGQLSEDC